jgi:hypothetical protein
MLLQQLLIFIYFWSHSVQIFLRKEKKRKNVPERQENIWVPHYYVCPIPTAARLFYSIKWATCILLCAGNDVQFMGL